MEPSSGALYQYEARHFFASDGNLRHFRRFVAVIVIVVTLLLMAVTYIDPSGSLAGHYYPVGIVPGVVTLGVILFGFVTDFYYATLPIGKIRREIATGHWDLVRLTAVDENALVMTHYTLTQRRAQRMIIVEQTLRYACIWLIAWNILSHGYYDLVVLVAVVMIAVPFGLEPRWRMHMLTAFGVACGVKLDDYNLSILATTPAIIVTRMLEMIVIYLAYALTVGLGSLGTLTMFTIIPLAGWLVFQIYEFPRSIILNQILRLNVREITGIDDDNLQQV